MVVHELPPTAFSGNGSSCLFSSGCMRRAQPLIATHNCIAKLTASI